MPNNVLRIPVQHRQLPHCPTCKRDVDTFNSFLVDQVAGTGIILKAITLHVKCSCGQLLDIRKSVKG
jgi:hypothetical protein